MDYGLDDLFYLGWAIQVTSRHLGVSPTDPVVVEPTLKAIGEMLEAEQIVAGPIDKDPKDGLLYVRSWDLSPQEAVDRIRKEWSERSRRLADSRPGRLVRTHRGRSC